MNEYERNQKGRAHIPVTVSGKDEVAGAATAVSSANNTADTTDWKDKYLRLAAENENSRKRLERSYAQQAQQAQEALLRDILASADSLERALQHSQKTADSGSLREGVMATWRQLQQTLANYGVQPILAEGQPFDPEQHEAIAVVPHSALPPHTVMRVEQTGYTIRDKLLRPARVIVTAG